MESTPNGYDPAWVEAINEVLSGRESPVRIKDIDPDTWDKFIGPMVDAIEDGEPERETYAIHPDDICEFPECDRLKETPESLRCKFHRLLDDQRLGKPVTDKEVEAAFMAD